jgi:acyl dehydratase
VYATVKRLLGTGTFRLALYNAAGASVATSAVVAFAVGDFASVSFTAPVVPGETYHLRGLTSNATTIVGTTGYLEAVRA